MTGTKSVSASVAGHTAGTAVVRRRKAAHESKKAYKVTYEEISEKKRLKTIVRFLAEN